MAVRDIVQAAGGGGVDVSWDLDYAYLDLPESLKFNFNTATLLNSVIFEDIDSTPQSIFFKPDGTKMYLLGGVGRSVYEFTLDVRWNVASKIFVQSFSVVSQESNVSGLFFSPDGTKMYVVGTLNDNVSEYNLSTPWDLSTTSYVQGFNVNAQEASPTGVFFKPDGTKMYVIGFSQDKVNEYNLSTAWDVSTASYLQNFSVALQESTSEDISFKPDGTKMYVVGRTSNTVYEYSLSTPWDLSTASYVRSFVATSYFTAARGLYFRPDGGGFFIYGDFNGGAGDQAWVRGFVTGGFDLAPQEVSPNGLSFKPDGTKFYIVGSSGDDVNEYNLSTAWDISTASYVQRFFVGGQEGIPTGVFFKPDGTKFYIVGGSTDTVYEYSLSTAWDVSTTSYVQGFSVAAQDSSPHDLFFKPDGTKMYVVGQVGDNVYEYNLSTPWSINTASYVQFFSVTPQDTSPTDIFFKPDGTKMYVSGDAGDDINVYNLSTAWDISTASYVQRFSVFAEELTVNGIFFKPDGTQFFIVGSSFDSVHSYTIGIQE